MKETEKKGSNEIIEAYTENHVDPFDRLRAGARETLKAPEEQIGGTETPSRKAEGNQGVGSVHTVPAVGAGVVLRDGRADHVRTKFA